MSDQIERTWMRKPCGPCPFSRSKTLWLHPERAEEFASMACNPSSNFPCHKTADYEEETEYREGGYVHGERSMTCNGFLSLQVNETGYETEGFEPHPDAFSDFYEMVEHHEEHWEAERDRRKSA